MKEILLSKNLNTFVDDKDFEWLSKYRWHAIKNGSGKWYAVRREKGRTIRMHNEILKTISGFEVDHKNGDGLDNRRDNLRSATRSQNNGNSEIYKNNTSGFKGVYWYPKKRKWRVQIQINGKRQSLGYFFDPVMASKIYNEKAKELFGEFARG